MARSKPKVESNTKFGNAFHSRVEKLFRNAGMNIAHSSFTSEGPDIIASDPETKSKLIIQCRSARSSRTYKGLGALIREYADRRRETRSDVAVIAFYNYRISSDFSSQDLEDIFKKKKVRILTDNLIKEYEDLVSKVNIFSKYQILSDLGISKNFISEDLVTPALKVIHPGFQYIVCTPSVDWLLKSSSVYRRNGPDQQVKGYQRILTRGRVLKDIPEYLRQESWVLPNAVICATQDSSKRIKLAKGLVRLPSKTGLLWVIDGQHRLYSFANVSEKLRSTHLLLVVFDSRLMGEKAQAAQADIFIKLNSNAKRVQTSLVLELLKDLLGTEDVRLKIAFKLCETKVLGDLIKTYSKKSGQIDLVTLSTTQPMKLLSKDDGPILCGKRYNSDDIKVKKVASYIESYFKEVKKVFEKEWGNEEYLISDNRGIRALLRILAYFFDKHPSASREEMLKVTKAAFRRLKTRETFAARAWTNRFLGEGGANDLAQRWIGSFSGIAIEKLPSSEGEQAEFKSTIRWDLDKRQINKELPQEITKALCAFKNTQGGAVFVGVDDDGHVIGLQEEMKLMGKGNVEDKLKRLVSQFIRNDLGTTEASTVSYELLYDSDKAYIKLSVAPNDQAIYFRRTKLFVRHGAESVLLEGQELEKYIRKRFTRI
jgi:DGQHR domain-containing protein